MKIGFPEDLQLICDFAKAYKEKCLKNNINHQRFLGPGDTFSFTCNRTNVCCRNFDDGERIMLDPYDVFRLSRNRQISTGRFLEKYAFLTLDPETHFPIALLNYQGKKRSNKCYFLRSYGCSVYKDRPLRCRLYPLGRIYVNGKSYFILIDNCPYDNSTTGKPRTISQWIEESEARDYLEYQDITNMLYERMDRDRYRMSPEHVKMELGAILYNIDNLVRHLPPNPRPEIDGEIMQSLKIEVEKFLIDQGYMRSDYKASLDLMPVS